MLDNIRDLGRPKKVLVAALWLISLILATVPGVAVAADPPDFDVPPTPAQGATLTATVGQTLQFSVQASDANVSFATQITAGSDHTCALLDSGVVRCWGLGIAGQLGYGNINSIGIDETPVTAGNVDVGGTVTQIDAGEAHTCAVLDTGSVRCWGDGGEGRLGYGNTTNIGDDETPASAGNVNVGGTVTQIAAGEVHTCALLDTGDVRCWGAGILGYSNTTIIGDDETPASAGNVDVGGTVTQIAAGGRHTCALLDTGDVRCWGRGTFGRLGYGNTTAIGDGESPASAGNVDVGATVTQIAAGKEHTCALLDTGDVRCWGESVSGRLGYGNTIDIGDNETPASAGNVNVGGTVTQIDAGRFHTCALLDTGNLRCWGGAGGGGFLGYPNPLGDIGDDETPASAGDVTVGGAVTQVAAGEAHTCALLEGGSVRCWGTYADGRLGYAIPESIGDDETPASAGDVDIVDPGVLVALGVTGLPALASFPTGAFGNPISSTFSWTPRPTDAGLHAITFTAQDTTNLFATPHAITIEVSQAPAVPPDFDVPPTPPQDATLSVTVGQTLEFSVQASDVDVPARVTQITVGDSHNCALLDTGAVRCWGYGGNGQLGYGNISNIGDDEAPATAGDVDVGGAVVQIDTGTGYTCAVLDTGSVRCWGSNDKSSLGYVGADFVGANETPASVGDVDVGGTVTQIATGFFHTCALLDTGDVRCWGRANFGRLGYGNQVTIGDDETPASAGDVDIGIAATQIAVGHNHTCALLVTSNVRCWGNGNDGALGYGNTTNVGDNESPASAGDVDLGGTVIQIAAGDEHTCALLDTGAVRCWGLGQAGRLGYGNTNDIGRRETPASAGFVDVGGTVTQIAAGDRQTCALLDTGAVRCWGSNGWGRLGYPNTDAVGGDDTPASAGDVDVGGIVTQIAAGFRHTCALLDTGSVRCWGFSLEGRLGYGNSNDIGDDETPASAGDVDVVDPGNSVTLGVTGLPALATFPPPPTANPVASTFAWTPQVADVGSHVITFTAEDSSSLFATPHTITVEVQPVEVIPSVTPWALAALAGVFALLLAWVLRRRVTAFST